MNVNANGTSASEPITVGREAAARLLGISVRMLDALVQRNEIPSVPLGRRRLFSVDSLREWAKARSA